MLKLFFTTDIHGSDICWRKFINAGVFYDAQALILGGDIVGKAVLLIERGADGVCRASRGGRSYEAATNDELTRLCKETRDAGFYPYVVDAVDAAEFRTCRELRDMVFERLVRESFVQWLEFADTKLAGSSCLVIVTSGNDDPFFCDDALRGSRVVRQAEGEVVDLGDGHQMINLGWTNPTPWQTHRECSEDELRARIDAQAATLREVQRSIFNLHAPPYNSGLDTASLLDQDLRPVEGGATKVPVGSTAVREAIECYGPLLGLHGHIHESRGTTQIGRTLCINPGSIYGQGLLAGALVTLDKGRIRGYQLLEG